MRMYNLLNETKLVAKVTTTKISQTFTIKNHTTYKYTYYIYKYTYKLSSLLVSCFV